MTHVERPAPAGAPTQDGVDALFPRLRIERLLRGLPVSGYRARDQYVEIFTRQAQLHVSGFCAVDYCPEVRALLLAVFRTILRVPAQMLSRDAYALVLAVEFVQRLQVIEQIFAIPGLGIHFVQAALQRDYTLAMALVVMYTALLCGMNLLVDIAYTYLDPRVKLE